MRKKLDKKSRYSVGEQLSRHFFRNTGLQPAVFPFHPELFHIKGDSQKEKLCADIRSASRQKPAESKVGFEQSEGAFCLDRAAQTQMDASGGGNIFLRLGSLLPKGFLQKQLLGFSSILSPAALVAAGTAGTILTAVPGRGDELAVFHLGTFPAQRRPPKIPCKRQTLTV